MRTGDKERGGWIFVSHSTKDIDAVYRVRDVLETRGHHPLLFFLRCLTEEDEIDNLITREIEARNFFLYCDSPNARGSAWVQRELEFIRSLPDRVVHEVDLEEDPVTQVASIRELSRAQTLFLSYANTDHEVVEAIAARLIEAEYRIWEPQGSFSAGGVASELVRGGVAEALDDGFVLVFLSPHSVQSEWVRHETEYALSLARHHPRGGTALRPIVLSHPAQMRGEFADALRGLEWLDVSDLGATDAARRIVVSLRRR